MAMVYRAEVRSANFIHVARGAETRKPAPKERMAAIKAPSVTSSDVGSITRRDVLCDGGGATNFDLIVASVAPVSGARPILLACCTALPARPPRV